MEYGLDNAKLAVKNHLPRAANEPSKIRTDAQVIIIVATDEIDNGIKVIPFEETKACNLQSNTAAALQTTLAPYLDTFSGKNNVEEAAIFHVIGGVCDNLCGVAITHDYNFLANKLGGIVGDGCQQDLGVTLQGIVSSIQGASSGIKLAHVPISSSLRVAIGSKEIPRSKSKGYDYSPESNTITFINEPIQQGDVIYLMYHYWK